MLNVAAFTEGERKRTEEPEHSLVNGGNSDTGTATKATRTASIHNILKGRNTKKAAILDSILGFCNRHDYGIGDCLNNGQIEDDGIVIRGDGVIGIRTP